MIRDVALIAAIAAVGIIVVAPLARRARRARISRDGRSFECALRRLGEKKWRHGTAKIGEGEDQPLITWASSGKGSVQLTSIAVDSARPIRGLERITMDRRVVVVQGRTSGHAVVEVGLLPEDRARLSSGS